MAAIVLNTIIMGLEHHNQPETLSLLIEKFNVAFTIFFAIELFFKVFAYGVPTFIRDGFNMLDMIVVLIK